MVSGRGMERAVVLGAVLGAGLAASALSSAQSGDHKPSARVLLERDPGARVGGDTIVVTGNGGEGLGVPDRPNFIVSLGSGDRVVGGSENSELGALGQHDTIVAGNGGHEVLHGGPHGTIVAGGSGHDVVIDNQPGTTIDLKSPGDEVIVTGRDDHVVCSGDSFHDQIFDNRSDTVNTTCHKNHDPVRPYIRAGATVGSAASADAARGAGEPVAHAAAVTGSGTNADPYVSTDCSEPPGGSFCTVRFHPRSLTGFWANEYVPAYRCNSEYPYLINRAYTMGVPKGVSLDKSPGSDVGITGIYYIYPANAAGTVTGFPWSSATNWSFGTSTYSVVLHCTSDLADSYRYPLAGGPLAKDA